MILSKPQPRAVGPELVVWDKDWKVYISVANEAEALAALKKVRWTKAEYYLEPNDVNPKWKKTN